MLKSLLKNNEIDQEEFKKAVISKMRDQYKTSLTGDYKNDPKNNFGLLEHDYEVEIEDKPGSCLETALYAV